MRTRELDSLRKELVELLHGGNAHAAFDDAVEGIASKNRSAKPASVPHSLWELVEHLRIAQHDILEFSRNPHHQSPKWPEGYWPASDGPADDHEWEASLKHFRSDLAAFVALVNDASNDLTAPIAHAPEGQSLLREALTLADHNSYHIGQIALLRKILGDWK